MFSFVWPVDSLDLQLNISPVIKKFLQRRSPHQTHIATLTRGSNAIPVKDRGRGGKYRRRGSTEEEGETFCSLEV